MQVKTNHKLSIRQKGFSLIELMIAMTLGLLLMTGVVQIFLSSKQAYSTVSGSSETLDNGRLALHFVSSSIGKAGYWGDVNFLRAYGSDQAVTAAQNAGTNAPYNDTYTGVFEENTYIFGLNNDNADAGVVDGTDQFYVRYNGNDFNPMTTCAGDPVNASSIAVERFYISTVNGTETLPSLVCETTILTLNQTTGEVSAPAGPEIKTQVLISGVENMQILYGQSNLNHDSVQLLTANNVTDWSLVESIRLAMLAASPEEVNTVTRSIGYEMLDITTAVPTDRRARRVFERTVAMRNVNYDSEN